MIKSNLRISTMTVYGHLGVMPNLQNLLDNGKFVKYGSLLEGMIKMQFNNCTRGLCSSDLLHNSAKQKKTFLNQASIVFRLRLEEEHSFKEVNIKLFKNGGFQMTGINCEKMARAALNTLIEQNKSDEIAVWTTEPSIKKFSICMINSDFSINHLIKREELHRLFIEEYGLRSFYEPTIYQGVNTKFFWNKESPRDAFPGICGCPEQCSGSGDGLSVGSCKRITIAPFRTGKIIINGAQSVEQIQDVYKFIVGVLTTHRNEVLWVSDSGERCVAGEPKNEKIEKKIETTIAFLQKKSRASPRQLLRLR